MSKLFLIQHIRHSQNDDFIDGEIVLSYCTNSLDIPYEKIQYVDCNDFGLKIMLQNLNYKDKKQNWYSHLDSICS